jgi:hypothetical protein
VRLRKEKGRGSVAGRFLSMRQSRRRKFCLRHSRMTHPCLSTLT